MTNSPGPSEIPAVETPRLRLRPHRREDFPACIALWADPYVTRYIGGKSPSREEVWARFLRYAGSWHWLGFGYWAVEELSTGQFIGELGYAQNERTFDPPLTLLDDAGRTMPQLGWVLSPEFHGKGYATEAVRAAVAWGDAHVAASAPSASSTPTTPLRSSSPKMRIPEFARPFIRLSPRSCSRARAWSSGFSQKKGLWFRLVPVGYHFSKWLSRDFLLAVNYPWLTYGADFGGRPGATPGSHLSRVGSRSRRLQSHFFLGCAGRPLVPSCDGRSGIRYENGIPVGPDDLLFTDIAAALELARQSNLRICFSLFDFLWLETLAAEEAASFPGRNALQFPGGREALLEHVLIPLFREFRGHRALFAWEIVNEPEWAIPEFQRSPGATLPFAEAHAFFAEIAQAIHEESGGIPVTLGSARLASASRLERNRPGPAAGSTHYPQLEKDQNLSLAAQLAGFTDLSEPLWLGELPARDPAVRNYSLEAALAACREAGLAGAGIWRWRPPEPAGSDVAFGSVEPERLSAWLAQSAEFRV